MIREAIILAGGFGTRLQSVVADLPKPMAPVNQQPFLNYLLDFCIDAKIETVVLSVGYLYQKVIDCYGEQYKNLQLKYAIEEEPLGTGGAIQYAMQQCITEDILILNGDSYLGLNIKEFSKSHKARNAKFSMALKNMHHFDRYGSVSINENNIVTQFNEKQFVEEGYINAGIYIIEMQSFLDLKLPKKFSFETDFLALYLKTWQFNAYKSNGLFIDIGIPEDFERAQGLFPVEEQS